MRTKQIKNKYDQKAYEIEKSCKKKIWKVKFIGAAIILITAIICFGTVIYSSNLWYFLIILTIAVGIEERTIHRKLDNIIRYNNEQISLIEQMQTIEELKKH